MATRRQRAKQRQAPSAPQPSQDYEHIGVVLRVRPLLRWERAEGFSIAVVKQGDHALTIAGPKAKLCRCDRAFDDTCDQRAFFRDSGVVPLIDSSFEGFRSTAFAYGQTGAGKTFTMVGGDDALGGLVQSRRGRRRTGDAAFNEDDGLLPRALSHVFERVNALRQKQKCRVRMTCLEIYRDVVTDMLAPEMAAHRPALKIREHASHGFFVEGLRACDGTSAAQCALVLGKALSCRRVGAHKLNARSSRSHCVVTLYVDSVHEGERKTYGSVSFVDLAGSERLKETGSGQDKRMLADAGHINKSLYTLGKVIRGLERLARDPKGAPRVPYRDSALTKLLISSLGGSSKTLMVGCCASSDKAVPETLRTVDFAARVRGIKNLPRVHVAEHQNLVQRLREEIARLKQENAALRSQLENRGPEPPFATKLEVNVDDAPDTMLPTWTSSRGRAAVSPLSMSRNSLMDHFPDVEKRRERRPRRKRRERRPSKSPERPGVRSPADMLPSVSPKKGRRRRGGRVRNRRRVVRDAEYALDHDPEDAYRDDDAQEQRLVAMLSQVATGGSPSSQFGDQATPPPQRAARRRRPGDAARSPSSEWSPDGSAGGGSLLSTTTPFGKRAAAAANAASEQDREDELTAMLMRAMEGVDG